MIDVAYCKQTLNPSTDDMTPTQPAYLMRVVLFLLLVAPVTSLMCYSCQSSRPFSDCESNVREFRKGANSKFAVNCSGYSNMQHDFCAIETYMQNGNANVILRECNDKTFSFSRFQPPYRKFKYLNPNNNTTMCTVVGSMAVCVTLCSTDMCNGPSSAPSSFRISFSFLIYLLMIYITFL